MLLGVTEPEDASYTRMRWNVPLSLEHAELLLSRLELRPGQRLADLGCGWGTLLRAAVARAGAGATGIGIDSDPAVLTRARAAADLVARAESELDADADVAVAVAVEEGGRPGGPVEFVEADVASWRGRCDRALCLGASHAFGGTAKSLRGLAEVVPAGGRVLFGDGFWEQPPGPDAVKFFGRDTLGLPGLLEACRATGWRVIHLSTADQREWDDFESTFRAGRQEWLLANPGHPRAGEIRDWLDRREREYVAVYRGVLGFAYLVLAR
jgi:SAM-dependent methyltransferase